jgi:hypothetical protein
LISRGWVLILLCMALLPVRVAAQQVVSAGDTNTPVKFLLVDTSTGQVGQTGKTGSSAGTQVALSSGVAGSITIKVQLSGNGVTNVPANGAGKAAEVATGQYDYYPASGEVTNATGLPLILSIDVSCSGCIEQVYTEEILPGYLPYHSASGGLSVSGGKTLLQNNAIGPSQITPAMMEAIGPVYFVSTGTTTGLVTADTYVYNGPYNGVRSYVSTTLGTTVYLWTDLSRWYFSTVLGTVGSNYFQTATSATATGPFTAQGGAGGTPSVAAHGTAVLAGFQPEVTLTTDASVQNDLTTILNTIIPGSPTSGSTYALIKAGLTGNSPQSGDSYARLGAPNLSSIDADIAAIPSAILLTPSNKIATLSSNAVVNNYAMRKNTAYNNFTFWMLSNSGQPLTGLTVTAQRSLDAAPLANCANAVVEVGGGLYSINFAAGDLNANTVALKCSATGAAPYTLVIVMNQEADGLLLALVALSLLTWGRRRRGKRSYGLTDLLRR